MLFDCASQIAPFPRLNIIAGVLTPPLFSATPRGWDGIQVQIYPGWEGEVTSLHPFHVISLQLEGSSTLTQRRDGKCVKATTLPGHIIITPAGGPKEWLNEEKTSSCRVLLLNLEPMRLREAVETELGVSAEPVVLQDNFWNRDPVIEGLGRQLLAETQAKESAFGMCVEGLTCQLAAHIVRRYAVSRRALAAMPTKLSRRKLRAVLDYIESNLAEDLTVADIAKTTCMSRSGIAHTFRQAMGMSLHRYVLERRIKRAQSLLTDTELPVSEVAQRVGFTTHPHFCTTFRRLTGISPLRFRHVQ